MSFQTEQRACRIHRGMPHLHVKACPTCLAPLADGACVQGHSQPGGQQLGTWNSQDMERWKCIEDLI